MKEKCLFLVNTPYQLMIAINLRKAEYANYDADVVITDNISDHKDLLDSVRCVGIFENVIAYNIKELYPDKNGVALARRLFGDKNIFDKAYDYYLFANLDHGASGIYRMLCKRNRHIKAIMFEDGYASYSGWYSDFLTMYGSIPYDGNVYKRLILKTWFHRLVDNVFCHVEKMLVFNPSIMTYKPSFRVESMKPIDVKNSELVETYNRIFKYDPSVDSYKEPIIFFEESYYADGYNVNDVEIVEKIASIVGKEKLFVKTHPRNPDNRFEKLGYKTNKNTSIPWEVICMNSDLSEKTLITIASVAAIVPATMLGKKYNGILLMKMIPDDSCLKKNITNLYEKVCEEHSRLHLVKTMQELEECISEQ